MARSPQTSRSIGRTVARLSSGAPLSDLARELIWILRESPTQGRLLNAVEHMWGHVRDNATSDDLRATRKSPAQLPVCTQRLALRFRDRFLLASTALSELVVYTGERP